MVYLFALLAVVAVWSVYAQLVGLTRAAIDVHNVWYRVTGDRDTPDKIAADLAKALKS